MKKQSGAVHMDEKTFRKLAGKHSDVTETAVPKGKPVQTDLEQEVKELRLIVNKLWAWKVKVEMFLAEIGYRGNEDDHEN